ncbi:MAG: GAF domain-containing protein [Okeania sp. SIO2F4]|uniref:hybrid sensor histidine kinase/response regulator n=1 Tax=Okeania sp. SIO2F4 TaxID=2607790 RepID=UPI00142A99A7|nr:ATP-binding protein [Okeania sp. SIO2F4]NES02717.1 GAF domain-containing protein [Okeania sp. SIO2F4]
MWQILSQLFLPNFIPRGNNLWPPEPIWLHLLSNLFIAIAYFSIPAILIYFLQKWKYVIISGVFGLLCTVMILCGIGHLMVILSLWYPNPFHLLIGIEKSITALIACYTTWQLVKLLPKFLSLKTPTQLEAINQQLETEIAQRQQAEAALEQTNQNLEKEVQQQTAELSTALNNLQHEIEKHQQTISSLQASAKREKVISLVIQKIRQSLDIPTIFQTTTQELQQTIYCDRVVIYQFNPDWSGKIVAESVESGWKILVEEQENDSSLKQNAVDTENCLVKDLTNPDVIEDTYLQEEKGGIYSQGTKYRVIENIYEAGFSDCYIQLLESFQAKAYIIVPIISNNKLWGLLASYQNSAPRKWENPEINIVIQIGSQLGVALEQAELLAETQRKSLMLEKALVAADEANLAKSNFIASMNHELRTPLNAIIGFTQLMNLDSSITTKNKEFIQIINQAGEHLLQLINTILEISRIEAGKTTLNNANFDLFALTNNIEQMFSLKALNKNLYLECKWDINVPQYIQTDDKKLRQVLINLLGNAIKFTNKGGVTLSISKTQEKNHLQFEVSDTGYGIAPEEIDKLFQAFEQTETGRKSKQGTGLGLTISQKFVQLMGGNISVSSIVGLGTKFTFNIEIQETELPKTETANPDNIIALAPHQPEYRILIVEILEIDSILLLEILSIIGFVVQEATEINQITNIWENWQPHLILIDLEILAKSGKEAIESIKRDSNNQPPVIFALTTQTFADGASKILSTGCDELIMKPFSQIILLEKIAEYLGVSYIYENGKPENNWQIDKPQNSLQKNYLTPEMLLAMPIEWVINLHRSALVADADLILNLAAEIPASNSDLSETLIEYVNQLKFEEITDLTEKIIDQEDNQI